MWSRRKGRALPKRLCFLAGALLLATNMWGVFHSLRNPDIVSDPDLPFRNDVTMTPREAREALVRRPGEDAGDYLRRATLAVQAAVAHYWDAKGADTYNLRVPFSENFILHILGRTWKGRFLRYEFSDHAKALERGVGLCSQHVVILAGYLAENGVESRIVYIDGHVVLIARNGEQWWLLDPDYGVVIERDYREAMEDLDGIREAYTKAVGPAVADNLTAIYAKRVWMEFASVRAYHSAAANNSFLLEKAAYVLKWLLPAVLMAPMLW